MNRLDKLKRLKNEISRLFYEEQLDVNDIFNQLRTDQQFSDITQGQVQSFYRHLQEESEDKNVRQLSEREQQIERNDQQIIEHQTQIANHERQIAEKSKQLDEHQRQMEKLQDQLAEKQQINLELEFMDEHCKHQQRLNKFLIYDDPFANMSDIKTFLQGRFLVVTENRHASGNVYTIMIQDLFQDTTKSFTVQKTSRLRNIHTLSFPYVLLYECKSAFYGPTYLRLAKFNFENKSLDVVQSFEFSNRCRILVNASDSSKFLLCEENSFTRCKLVDEEVQFGKRITLRRLFDSKCGSYFDTQLYVLDYVLEKIDHFEIYNLIQVRMIICNLETSKKLTYDLNSTPEGLDCLNPNDQNNFAWIRDTVFLTIKLSLLGKHGIIFTNPQMRNWKFVEFGMVDLQINHIQSFGNETLMICAKKGHQERKIYKLQMRKPDSLCNMAWISIIKLLKEANVKNPYEEVRQYLPSNSELQPFVFAED